MGNSSSNIIEIIIVLGACVKIRAIFVLECLKWVFIIQIITQYELSINKINYVVDMALQNLIQLKYA